MASLSMLRDEQRSSRKGDCHSRIFRPTDPLIYRLYEVIGVYGDTLKEVIQEKFGDGIMSAIDFSMEVDKIEDPKGDRVLLTLNGKFLSYKSW
jgi:cyanate lyase